jgi:hypothetical protein
VFITHRKDIMQDIILTITLKPTTGQVSVSGPIDNKTMAYGMLATAKDAIYDYGKQQQNRIIQPAPIDYTLPTLD